MAFHSCAVEPWTDCPACEREEREYEQWLFSEPTEPEPEEDR